MDAWCKRLRIDRRRGSPRCLNDVIAKLLLLLDLRMLNLHKKKDSESDINQEKLNNKVVSQIAAEGGSCLQLWRS